MKLLQVGKKRSVLLIDGQIVIMDNKKACNQLMMNDQWVEANKIDQVMLNG